MTALMQGPIQFSKTLFVGINALARRRAASIFLVFILSFAGSWLTAACRGIPVPIVQDEFSYLLAADTFVHGRWTNPPHPMRKYFETFHVLQEPSYMSMYPPGQGLFLGLGQRVFGHPVYGVWLSAGLMCAAICWMLYAWVPPQWALIGGLVAVLQFGVFTYWSQSYWGGAVGALGGALVFGALPRIFKTHRIRDALWLGLGLAVLANSRPLEGFLCAIAVGCLVLPWKIQWQRIDKHRLLIKAALPFALLTVVVALLTGYYNKKVTGHVWLFPQMLYAKTYLTIPMFTWQPLYPPVHYNHQPLADYVHQQVVKHFLQKRTLQGLLQDLYQDFYHAPMFFFGYPLALPSLAVAFLLFFHHKTAVRFWIAFLILLGAWACMPWNLKPHYFSPMTCLVVLLVTLALRTGALLTIGCARVGLVFIVFLMALQLILNVTLTPFKWAWLSLGKSIQSPIALPAAFTREQLKEILIKQGGRYLVVVNYPLSHNFFYEWVYNDADIDHAPIVWAMDMGKDHNKDLLDYFSNRQVLFVQVYKDRPGFFYFDQR
jgi:hypothetical protein